MIQLLIQVALTLLVVLLLMWGLARVIRRPLGIRGNESLSVLGSQQVGRGAAVAVVRVADRALVIGITDTQVSLLVEHDLEAFVTEPEEEHIPVDLEGSELPGRHPAAAGGRLDGSVLSPRTWMSAVDSLRERTARPERTARR
ncbi:flagellar protein FliO/FliZ [Actinoplanes lutulentus]|uniref:Flagellar protein FliO/FliZ n=1 Tax=Actinoplanes lutulentus TaxID=1287878 RepID=A0A327ZI58_9ACTN|nr:flagellar biosynthetic protein FliO [Actinoplanes lutulentus]MBB2945854.1 flagellar protein FliO/FliZ [Actinoplanes lutulentus]RAK37903.1 flagellar protein FliO/FliZ [Actinoplanes lutulentus]